MGTNDYQDALTLATSVGAAAGNSTATQAQLGMLQAGTPMGYTYLNPQGQQWYPYPGTATPYTGTVTVTTEAPESIEEIMRRVCQEEFKKILADLVDRLSSDGITIPIEELKKELNKS
jgi:hypothetical protein